MLSTLESSGATFLIRRYAYLPPVLLGLCHREDSQDFRICFACREDSQDFRICFACRPHLSPRHTWKTWLTRWLPKRRVCLLTPVSAGVSIGSAFVLGIGRPACRGTMALQKQSGSAFVLGIGRPACRGTMALQAIWVCICVGYWKACMQGHNGSTKAIRVWPATQGSVCDLVCLEAWVLWGLELVKSSLRSGNWPLLSQAQAACRSPFLILIPPCPTHCRGCLVPWTSLWWVMIEECHKFATVLGDTHAVFCVSLSVSSVCLPCCRELLHGWVPAWMGGEKCAEV